MRNFIVEPETFPRTMVSYQVSLVSTVLQWAPSENSFLKIRKELFCFRVALLTRQIFQGFRLFYFANISGNSWIH